MSIEEKIFFILFIIAGIASVGAPIYVFIYIPVMDKRRSKALQGIAGKLKLKFSCDDQFDIWNSHSYHFLFQKGNSSEATNIIYGLYKGKTLYCFDYYYFDLCDKRKNSNVNKWSFYCVLYDFNHKVHMKCLYIKPEGFLDKIEDEVGFEHINFESYEFNRKFYVKGEDKKFAYGVIHPRMMEFFLQNKVPYSFELKDHSILLYKKGKLNAQEVECMLDTMANFVGLLPEYLLEQLKTGQV